MSSYLPFLLDLPALDRDLLVLVVNLGLLRLQPRPLLCQLCLRLVELDIPVQNPLLFAVGVLFSDGELIFRGTQARGGCLQLRLLTGKLCSLGCSLGMELGYASPVVQGGHPAALNRR